jgi:protein-tyrosine phosphatase
MLNGLGVPVDEPYRKPRPVTADDFSNADIIVAVKESEHRPVIATLYPEWADRVEYWSVDDLDCATPEEALPQLKEEVRALVQQLKVDGIRESGTAPSGR